MNFLFWETHGNHKKINNKMNKKLNYILVAASTLLATSTFAAEPCKAYVKLDLGYSLSSGTKAYGPALVENNGTLVGYQAYSSLDVDQRGMIGDLAVGYAFNDAMRAEVSFDFKPNMKSYADTYAVQSQQLGGSARLLYDFNNNTSVTPFVFGGLGALNIKPTVKPFLTQDLRKDGTPYVAQINLDGSLKQDANNNIFTYSSLNMPSKTVMTYQTGFGLAFKASEEVSIDLTYGLGGQTSYQTLVNTAVFAVAPGDTINELNANGTVEKFQQIKFKNQMDQSLTLGVRFTM